MCTCRNDNKRVGRGNRETNTIERDVKKPTSLKVDENRSNEVVIGSMQTERARGGKEARRKRSKRDRKTNHWREKLIKER